jgi:hypothetical protein
MFRALLAHYQKVLHIRKLVYFVPIISTGDIIRTNIPIVVYAMPPDDEQVVLEICRGC